MRIRTYSVAAALGALLVSAGCGLAVNFFGDPSTPYHKRLSKETRDASFFGMEKVKYLTSVTYRSRPLREAYVEEYAERYGLKPEEKEIMRAKELEEADQYDVFFISHFSSDKDAIKLEKSAKVWKLTLEGAGGETVDPESITTVPTDSISQYFYPYVSQWSKNFLIKFKKGATPPSNLTLRMTGVLADVRFSWTVNSQATP